GRSADLPGRRPDDHDRLWGGRRAHDLPRYALSPDACTHAVCGSLSMGGVRHLIMPSELCRQMFSHAKAAQPQEAVGLLGGTPDGRARCVLQLPNLATSDKQFIADPFAQFCALQRLKSEQLELLGIYHSHPGGGVEPSREDLNHAKRWVA